MVERGDIYHPLRWTPREAHAFLKEVPALEAAGVVVRVPDWWNARAPPRPQVHVTVGGRPPSQLGTDALLDFSVQVALDGDPLSPDERRAILRATDGLVLIKGRWVEADGARLRDSRDAPAQKTDAPLLLRGASLPLLAAALVLKGAFFALVAAALVLKSAFFALAAASVRCRVIPAYARTLAVRGKHRARLLLRPRGSEGAKDERREHRLVPFPRGQY